MLVESSPHDGQSHTDVWHSTQSFEEVPIHIQLVLLVNWEVVRTQHVEVPFSEYFKSEVSFLLVSDWGLTLEESVSVFDILRCEVHEVGVDFACQGHFLLDFFPFLKLVELLNCRCAGKREDVHVAALEFQFLQGFLNEKNSRFFEGEMTEGQVERVLGLHLSLLFGITSFGGFPCV